MGSHRQLRDPIHTFIDLNSYEADLIESPVFQRLRRIRQLAFAYLVYPSAVHTRFEHSLGVKHIANKMATRLLDSSEKEAKDIISYAALLHDIGHGPFSHVSEDALDLCNDISTIPMPSPNTKVHELITTRIIQLDPVISRHLSEKVIDKICKLLTIGFGPPLWKSIVSGPLDADKQDYLLRDSYFCGVKYGIFDLEQLHRDIIKIEDKSTGDSLGISASGINATEQFFLAKRFLLTQVLNHRVRRIADQMLLRAIVVGIEDESVEQLASIYKFEDNEKYINNYLAWDDFTFFSFLTSKTLEGKICHNLIKRLAERKLFKRIYRKPIDQFEPTTREILIDLNKPKHNAIRANIESYVKELVEKKVRDTPRIRKSIECQISDHKCWIAHVYKVDSIRTMAKNDQSTSILVRRDDASIVQFDDESKLFNSVDPNIKDNILSIYAPIYYETATDRDLLIGLLNIPITETIETACKERS